MTDPTRPTRLADPADPLPVIEAHLATWSRGFDLPPRLVHAVEYALLGGGKRTRPLLAWHASLAAGGTGHDALDAALAVELVHCFSLVHDDLPAMDDDDLRRGKPTLHRHAGEASAILAGDAMLALAFGVIADRSPTPALAAALAHELAQGSAGMIAGQIYDTLGGLPQGLDPESQARHIHERKTGALIVAACRMGARCGLHASGRADDRGVLPLITEYARAVGLMFQIADDLIDVEQPHDHAGKRTNKDKDAGKVTYPGVMGVAAARERLDRLHARALDRAAALGSNGQGLALLADSLARRTR